MSDEEEEYEYSDEEEEEEDDENVEIENAFYEGDEYRVSDPQRAVGISAVPHNFLPLPTEPSCCRNINFSFFSKLVLIACTM